MACSRLVSLATGWASSRLPWTKLEHRKIVIAASAFGNTNSALLMLVSAMCAQQSLPFFGALGDQCVKNVCPALCHMLSQAACLIVIFSLQISAGTAPETTACMTLEET